jgi:hypothetical protein
VARFSDALCGPPSPCVPPCGSHSRFSFMVFPLLLCVVSSMLFSLLLSPPSSSICPSSSSSTCWPSSSIPFISLQLPGSYLPFQFLRQVSISPPTSLQKGEGRVRSGLAGALLAGPTSLNRGEGLLAGLGGDCGGEGGGGGSGRREDKRTSTVMGLMFNSNSAHPLRVYFTLPHLVQVEHTQTHIFVFNIFGLQVNST